MIQTAVLPARRNAIDYHAFGVPKDLWHDSMKSQIVNPKPEHLFALWFHKKTNPPSATPPIGVALTQAEYGGEGVEFNSSPMSTLLPDYLLAMGKDAILSFDVRQLPRLLSYTYSLSLKWPGYAHLKYKAVINMDTTLGDLAAQVVRVFKHFYEKVCPSYPLILHPSLTMTHHSTTKASRAPVSDLARPTCASSSFVCATSTSTVAAGTLKPPMCMMAKSATTSRRWTSIILPSLTHGIQIYSGCAPYRLSLTILDLYQIHDFFTRLNLH